MTAYYNEFDPYAAQWLRNLIDAGLIPKGDVDERSIVDVQPGDLAGYAQCHFFAGIGGWALAARLAGWPDDRELWTGSCPCQPFSVAGKQQGSADERHLWPHYLRLVRARRPVVVMGEQVAAAIGKDWLDGVRADLYGEGYTCRAIVLPACSVDSPHRRDRIWFVGDVTSHMANSDGARRTSGLSAQARRYEGVTRKPDDCRGEHDSTSRRPANHRHVADADVAGSGEERKQRSREQRGTGSNPWARHSWIVGHDGKARRVEPSIRLLAHGVPARVGRLRAYGNAIVPQVAAEVIAAYMECAPGCLE